jgi:hypothetical protein
MVVECGRVEENLSVMSEETYPTHPAMSSRKEFIKCIVRLPFVTWKQNVAGDPSATGQTLRVPSRRTVIQPFILHFFAVLPAETKRRVSRALATTLPNCGNISTLVRYIPSTTTRAKRNASKSRNFPKGKAEKE